MFSRRTQALAEVATRRHFLAHVTKGVVVCSAVAGFGAEAAADAAVVSMPRDAANVKDFGAIGNGATDDTRAIQAAMDSLAFGGRQGGIVYLPRGRYLLVGTLVPKSENIILMGDGKRNSQKPLGESTNSVPATLFKTGTGACIRIDNRYSCNGFGLRSLTLQGAKANRKDIYGVEFFISSSDFRRDFLFEQATISGFNTALLLNRDAAASEAAIGMVHVLLCSIMHNKYIWRQTGREAQVNGIVFEKNDAGQNGYSEGGGIYGLRAHNIAIRDNILEGQRDPIFITGAYRSIFIENNYFEANVGEACIEVRGASHGVIGPNSYFSVLTNYKAKMLGCQGFTVRDPAWQSGSILCDTSQYSADHTSWDGEYAVIVPPDVASLPMMKMDKACAAHTAFRSDVVHSSQLPGAPRREQWTDGRVICAGEKTYEPGQLLVDTFALTARVGEFLVATYALLYQDPPDDLYIGMRINASSDRLNGSWSGTFENSRLTPSGEWMILTLACRALVAVSSLEINLFPFGLKQAGAKTVRGLKGSVYACADPSRIRPLVDVDYAQAASAAPAAGTWKCGDRLYNISPSAADSIGFVCVSGGTPGMWKSYGNISS